MASNSSLNSDANSNSKEKKEELQLLAIQPRELKFPFELNKQISCPLQLTNKTDNFLAFKVKTTSPKKYCVRPSNGVVEPQSTCEVVVTMQAQQEAPPDMQCKDKFLVQSAVVSESFLVKDITPQMFAKEEGNVVEELKLRVVYQAVSEASEDSTMPTKSEVVVDNGTADASDVSSGLESFKTVETSVAEYDVLKSSGVSKLSEPLATTRAYAEPKEKSPETAALIARLTEEKKSAVQHNTRLRQELDVMRREVSKQQGGFSLAFVVIITVLGIILGFFMKK